MKPRTDGGVREDMAFRTLKQWRADMVQLPAAISVMVGVTSTHKQQLAAAIANTATRVASYVTEHPDQRVRYSGPLHDQLAGLRRECDALQKFLETGRA